MTVRPLTDYVGATLLAIVLVSAVAIAQEPAKPPVLQPGLKVLTGAPAPAKAEPSLADRSALVPPPVPTISEQDSRAALEAQAEAVAMQKGIVVLQEKLDAATAQFTRIMQKLQRPNLQITLGPNGLLTYVPTPPEKK